MLPDQHQHAPGGGDAEDVEHDRLQRQQQRAERARQQDERRDRDQRDHQREAAVDGVDEVGVRGRLAADAHVGTGRVRGVAHGLERGLALGGSAVGDLDRLDERGAVAPPVRDSWAPRRRGCRRPGAGPRPPSAGRCRPRPGSRGAGSIPRRCRPSPVPRGRPWRRRTSRPCRRRRLPSCRSVAAKTSARITAMPAPAASQRWRATPVGPAGPGAARLVVGAPVGPVEPRPELRQHDGQQGDRDQRRDQRDQQAAVAHRAQERQGQRDQREQADRDRDAAEDDRATGGLHRALHRLLAARTVRALLTPARHDDQRVVDRDPEADQRDQELHDRRDAGQLGQYRAAAGRWS